MNGETVTITADVPGFVILRGYPGHSAKGTARVVFECDHQTPGAYHIINLDGLSADTWFPRSKVNVQKERWNVPEDSAENSTSTKPLEAFQ